MSLQKQHQTSPPLVGDLWIIQETGKFRTDLDGIEDVSDDGSIKEYKISDFAGYLLNPNPLEVKKRLIGCEIHYCRRRLNIIREKISRIFPSKLQGLINTGNFPPEVLVSNSKLKIPALKDPELEAHFLKIQELLRSYDSVTKRLPQLNPHRIAHVIGICEDIGGNLSYLKLQGGIEEKIKYLTKYISEDVGVVLRKAHIADGLFELRGFNFEALDASDSRRLISFLKDGKLKVCLLNRDDKVAHGMDAGQLLNYLYLLQHSLQANPSLRHVFNLCRRGKAIAVKLFFNRKLEIDYSKTHFPKIYREVFNTYNVKSNQRNLVKPSLNYLQIGVSLNYVPLTDSGEDRLHTHISILHDLRAIETLKNNLPQVYSEISKGAFISEAGRFYLLDSIEGHGHVQ